MNPFLVVGYKSPKYFCDRKNETEKIISAVANHRNLTLYSLRRVGKTALIHHSFHNLKSNKEYKLLYLDISPTSSSEDFINIFGTSILRQFGSQKGDLLKMVGNFFKSIRPSVEFDPLTGNPSLQFKMFTERDVEVTIESIFELLSRQKERLAIAIDEFQQIMNYPQQNMEALLRKNIQMLTNSTFIFSGSEKHMLTSMFSDEKRPFYKSTEMMHLDNIEKNVYTEFILNHFKRANINISEDVVSFILDWTKLYTFNVQYVCNKLYGLGLNKITGGTVKNICFEILKEYQPVFLNYRNLLTAYQWNLLKAIAKEGRIKKVTSNAFINKYNLNSASSVQTGLKGLINKDLLNYEDNQYELTDIFLNRWLEIT